MTDQNQQASEAVELLPCPFCGTKDVEIANIGVELGDPEYAGRCKSCYFDGPSHPYKHSAINQWNTRALTPKCDAGAVEKILNGIQFWKDSDESACRLRITQALQSRDAENARLNERVRELERSLGAMTCDRDTWKEKAESEESRWRDDVISSREARDKSDQDRDRLSAELARVKKDEQRLDFVLSKLDDFDFAKVCAIAVGDLSDEPRDDIDRAIAEAEGEEK